jgi:hypothetical protein
MCRMHGPGDRLKIGYKQTGSLLYLWEVYCYEEIEIVAMTFVDGTKTNLCFWSYVNDTTHSYIFLQQQYIVLILERVTL